MEMMQPQPSKGWSMKPQSSMKRMEPMSSMQCGFSREEKSLCAVKCNNKKCRPKLIGAVEKCKVVEKECIKGQFSDEDKKSRNLKCN